MNSFFSKIIFSSFLFYSMQTLCPFGNDLKFNPKARDRQKRLQEKLLLRGGATGERTRERIADHMQGAREFVATMVQLAAPNREHTQRVMTTVKEGNMRDLTGVIQGHELFKEGSSGKTTKKLLKTLANPSQE